MTSYPILQRYDSTALLSITTATQGGALLCVDSANNRFFAFKNGSRDSATAGIYRFAIDTGVQAGVLYASTMFAGDSSSYATIEWPLCLTPDGSIFLMTSAGNAGGSNTYRLVDGTTMTMTAQYSGVPAFEVGHGMAATKQNGFDFVLQGGSGSGAFESTLFEAHGSVLIFAGHRFATTESSGATPVAGPAGTTYTFAQNNSGTLQIGVYKTVITSGADNYNSASWPGSPNAFVTTTKIGTVLATAIDAGWSSGFSAGSFMYDASDGHLVFMAAGTGGTHPRYLVKISHVDASVQWVLSIDTNFAGGGDAAAQGLNGTLWLVRGVGGSDTEYEFDTTAGTLTASTAFSSTNSLNDSLPLWDAASNSVWVKNSFGGTSVTPPYLATGTTPGGVEWARYIVATSPTPPSPPSPPPTPRVSLNRAWTYIMDGHQFYVIDLGSQGTFVYDMDTQAWSEYQTNGGNWSMVAGCMFGDRIVAGDLATTDVWELVPTAVSDSGSYAYDIAHAATGGLTARSRVYHSCASVRLALSWGEYQDVTDATISLSYSDDFGETYSTPQTITLTEGDFTSEIVWNSLGSFAAPGRIFRITDVGGPLRIDGADAMIDDFDNDKNPQQQT